jgi:hypothetical protein
VPGSERNAAGKPDSAIHLTTTSLQIQADDQPGGSGVAEMQVGFDPMLQDAVWQPFQSHIDLPLRSGQIIYMQVRDQVGNVSAITSTRAPYNVYVPFARH